MPRDPVSASGLTLRGRWGVPVSPVRLRCHLEVIEAAPLYVRLTPPLSAVRVWAGPIVAPNSEANIIGNGNGNGLGIGGHRRARRE